VSGRKLLRANFQQGGAIQTLWRPLIDWEHATLCKQFGLDPCSFYFDLPSSARGTGSTVAGAGGTLTGGRKIDGYILHGGTRRPIGTLTLVSESERFRDVDPCDEREMLRLG
jgi:hypothetical protein